MFWGLMFGRCHPQLVLRSRIIALQFRSRRDAPSQTKDPGAGGWGAASPRILAWRAVLVWGLSPRSPGRVLQSATLQDSPYHCAPQYIASSPQYIASSPQYTASSLPQYIASSHGEYIASSLPQYIASSHFARRVIALCTEFCHSILPRHRTELSQYIASSHFAKSRFAPSSATAHGTELYLSIYLFIYELSTTLLVNLWATFRCGSLPRPRTSEGRERDRKVSVH